MKQNRQAGACLPVKNIGHGLRLQPVPDRILLHNLRQLAGLVALSHFFQWNDLDFRRLAFATERLEAGAHDLLGSSTGWLEEVARVELRWIFKQEFTGRSRHRQADVGIDIDLAHAVTDAFLDFFYRHAVGFFHVTAKFTDDGQQFLWYRRRTVHHQMGVRDAGVDFLDAVDRQDIAGRLAGELVSAMRSTDGDCQRVALGALHEVGRLGDVGQQLLACHRAFSTVAVFLVALHGFQRTEHAQFRFHRHADGVREFHHFTRHFHVVFVGSDRLAVGFQRTVHHDGREARADGAHADGWRLAMVLMHDNRNVWVGFDGSVDQVTQERFACVLACASGRLHDHRAVERIGGSHDGLHLLQVIDVESRDAITVFGGMVQQLTHGYERHGNTPENEKLLRRFAEDIRAGA